MAFVVIWIVSLIFWAVVSLLAGGGEPWDADRFWTTLYPTALALSVILGLMLKSSQWSAGAIVMLSQIPVVMASSGASPLLAAGVVYAAILSIPAVALSWLAGTIRRRYGGK